MDIKEKQDFDEYFKEKYPELYKDVFNEDGDERAIIGYSFALSAWQAAKTQAVPDQLDVNSILHDIDCYFDNGLSNTERAANNLLQSIYEKLGGEVKAQEQGHA